MSVRRWNIDNVDLNVLVFLLGALTVQHVVLTLVSDRRNEAKLVGDI